MKIMRFGIVGTGAIAEHYKVAFAELGKLAVLTACCDKDMVKADKFAVECGAAAFANLEEMATSGLIDAICICTPPPTHAALAIQAAKAGLHILIEKPLATTLRGAEQVITEARANGVTLSVVSQRRWLEATQRVRWALDQGLLGNRILMGDAYCEDWKGPEAFFRADWRRTWKGAGGGVLINQMFHSLDLLFWLMGKPTEVFGYWQNLTHIVDMEMDDNAVAVMRFVGGGLATMRASISVNPPRRLHGITLLGENGRMASIDAWTFDEGSNDIWTVDADKPDVRRRYRNLHACQIADFVESIRDGRPPVVTAESGLRVVAAIQGIYQGKIAQIK